MRDFVSKPVLASVYEAGTSAEDNGPVPEPAGCSPRKCSQHSSSQGGGSEPQPAGMSQLSDLSQLDTMSQLEAAENGPDAKADGSQSVSLSQYNNLTSSMPPFDALSQVPCILATCFA